MGTISFLAAATSTASSATLSSHSTSSVLPHQLWGPSTAVSLTLTFPSHRATQSRHLCSEPVQGISTLRSRVKYRAQNAPVAFAPLPQRAVTERSLLAAQSHSAHDAERLSGELSLSGLCLPFPCLQQCRIWALVTRGERGKKKREEKNPPPPAEQPLDHNKAGAAAKSREPLLSNAHRALGRPLPQSGRRARGWAQRRAPREQSQGQLSPMGAAVGQAGTGAPQPGRHRSPMHGHFAKHSCSPRAGVPSELNLSSRVPTDPWLAARHSRDGPNCWPTCSRYAALAQAHFSPCCKKY